jgi:Spy/CpxP family protein refolding chaperone
MLIKLLIRVLVALVALATLAPAASAAGAPTTPTPSASPTAPSQSLLQAPAVQSARALRESLTASQRSALAGIMQRHQAEVRAANTSLTQAQAQAAGRAASRGAPSAADASALAAAVEASRPVMTTVQNEFLAVMTPGQRAQFQQTLSVQPAARGPRLADAVDADPCNPTGVFFGFYATNYSRVAFFYANLNFLTFGTSNSFNGFVWALADMTLATMASDNLAAGNCATAKDQFMAAGNAGVNAFNFELADFNMVGQYLAFWAYVYSASMFNNAFQASANL